MSKGLSYTPKGGSSLLLTALPLPHATTAVVLTIGQINTDLERVTATCCEQKVISQKYAVARKGGKEQATQQNDLLNKEYNPSWLIWGMYLLPIGWIQLHLSGTPIPGTCIVSWGVQDTGL